MAKKAKPTITEVSDIVKSDIQRMKEYLEKQPKINFLIPLMPGDTAEAYDTVCLNGYVMQIKKGVLVSLPKPVVDILAEKYKVEMTAGSDMLANRNREITEALN